MLNKYKMSCWLFESKSVGIIAILSDGSMWNIEQQKQYKSKAKVQNIGRPRDTFVDVMNGALIFNY